MKQIESMIDWISAVVESENIIIVEGPYDKKALENVGISNEIVVINDGKGLFETVEQVVEIVEKSKEKSEIDKDKKEVILLTDFDKKGKELYGKLKKDIVKHGVKIDNKFREWLRRRTKISHIEGIDSYVDNDGYVRK
ncbi:toprim domain-containing protein [Candidatus Woesearchaeota archaeon]|jgi:5S rRNA maturation endonuclease (ribonuclease M5)|nr:toprim domain-containing protein [Candidatus Woesearchaeota archaeon]